MTIQETRQLGIEFERRVQTMIPETEFARKLDTETIYSFLNQYQDKYIHEIYRNLDKIEPESKLSAHVDRVLQEMLTDAEITNPADIMDNTSINDENGIHIVDTARSITYNLPEDFYLYVRSVSKVSSTYSFKGGEGDSQIRILPNKLVSQNDVWKVIETPHDSLRILRYPVAVLSKYRYGIDDKHGNISGASKEGKFPTITVIYDQYTTSLGIKVLYYKQPSHFSILTNTPCELPMDAFDDLVSGAVDLYVQYAAGAEARRRQQQEEANKRAREDQRDARRNRADND
jgi:hypothetical protein